MSAEAYRADRLRDTLSGTPEQICDRVAEYVEYGIRYFFIVFPDPAPSETLALFAEEVMSRFVTVNDNL